MSIGDGWRRFAPVASLCVFLVGAGQSTTVNASELARCNVFAASPYNIIVAPSVITWRDVSDNRFDDEQNSPVAQFIANPGYDWSLIARSIAGQAAAPISGLASTYNPLNNKDIDAGSLHTASGEIYDPDGWTAAIQIDLRWIFSGVRYGRNYRPSFALVEAGDKRAIVRINDVGPLAPGRIIDLNTRAMHYFDPSMRTGVLNVSVTPLMGNDFVAGPIEPPAVVMAGNLPTIR
jgi:rare lipoprotein A